MDSYHNTTILQAKWKKFSMNSFARFHARLLQDFVFNIPRGVSVPVAATTHVHERCIVTAAMKYIMSGILLEEAGTTSIMEL